MKASALMSRLKDELYDELIHRMLPYWVSTVDNAHGGFLGRIKQNGDRVRNAAKGSVLNARILWTFSAAHRVFGDDNYRVLAERAFEYLQTYFWDPVDGGVFWSVDHLGTPLETRKQTYAQAFALYGLSEYHRATGEGTALSRAIQLFRLIEAHAHDGVQDGYLEALGRSWKPIGDVRLSEKDLNAPKSMNTHLHVLEAYTNLLHTWPDGLLADRTGALLSLFLDRIYSRRSKHMHTFFELDWTPISPVVSFGHDIEAGWLMLEAADVVGDEAIRGRIREIAVALARSVLQDGLDNGGGLNNELLPGGRTDGDKYWWVQAEAIVGFLNAYQETHSLEFLEAAVAIWDFTRNHLLDKEHGEWYFRVNRDGKPFSEDDKVGMWKCPYHGARACLEVITRIERLEQAQA